MTENEQAKPKAKRAPRAKKKKEAAAEASSAEPMVSSGESESPSPSQGDSGSQAEAPVEEVRVEAQIEAQLAADAPAATSDEEPMKRRVRRSATVEVPDLPEEPAVADPPADERGASDAAPAPKRQERDARRSDRPPRPRRPPRGESRHGGPGMSAVLQSPQRKVYRQDVVATRPDEPPKPASSRRPDINEKDKITLILHPAPKPGAHRAPAKKKDRPLTAKEALRAKAQVGQQDKKKEPKQPAAPVALDKAWLSADADSAGSALRAAGTAGEELVKAWLDAGNVAALARAAQLEDVASVARKAARRAINVLKSRGVDIPKVEEPKAQAAGPDPCVAKFIPPDAAGTSFVSISQRQAGGRYHVADVLYRSGVGVVHATAARLAGHHIRDWEVRIEKQFGAKPVNVPVEWARHQVATARAQNDVSKAIIPLGFDSCQSLLTPAPQSEPAHPLADLEGAAADDVAIEKARLESDRLHNEPEFRTWLPDRAALDDLLRKVGERLGGETAAQDPKQVDEALKVEVAAATDRFFSPELREELSLRMRAAAISVRARAGDDLAKRVLGAATAVRNAGLITSPPSEVPFLLSFFQKAVAMMVRQGAGQLRVPVPARAEASG